METAQRPTTSISVLLFTGRACLPSSKLIVVSGFPLTWPLKMRRNPPSCHFALDFSIERVMELHTSFTPHITTTTIFYLNYRTLFQSRAMYC
ncbi:hypothetical protein Peur_046257 [Populus x canadensis]